MNFSRLPIGFFIVGNHGDISRFLQELIQQIEMMVQQQQQVGLFNLFFYFKFK